MTELTLELGQMLWVHTPVGHIQMGTTAAGLKVSVTAKDGIELISNLHYPTTKDGILPSWHVDLVKSSRSSMA